MCDWQARLRNCPPDELFDVNLPLVLLDTKGRITYADHSAERILGYPPSGLEALAFDSLFSARNPQWLPRVIRKIGHKEGWAGEAVLARLDGQERWFEIQCFRTPRLLASFGYVILLMQDATDRIEMTEALMCHSEELFHRNRELELVNKIGKLMLESSDLDTQLDITLREAAKRVSADGGIVCFKDPSSDRLVCRGTYGVASNDMMKNFSVGIDDTSLIAHTARIRKCYMTDDVTSDPHAIKRLVRYHHLKSALCAPLFINGDAIGVLMLGDSRKHRKFTPEEITLVQIIANHAASALRLSTSAAEPRVTREMEAAA